MTRSTHMQASNRNAPARTFNLAVLEYDDAKWGQSVLIRVTSGAVLSLGFDLTPDDALAFADALARHANALKKAAERAERLAAMEAQEAA